MKKIVIIIFAAGLFASCQPQSKENNNQSEQDQEKQPTSIDMTQYPELLQKALEAHGGLDTWKSYAALSYDISWANKDGSENHLTNLYNRKVLIDRDSVKIGFDGDQVWVSPDLASFGNGSPRFYHNLYFYFFGIPYLLADPGINYEDQGIKTIQGKDYRALKVSYNEGVGDSDEDLYIALFNPESYKLEVLLYTVTYFSGEKSESYNALKYPDWKNVGGLLLPTTIKGHKYAADTLGDLRYEVSFSNISLDVEAPSETLFQIPENAEIDSLKSE